MAKLACDQLCQRTLRIRQQIDRAHCTYSSTLLAHTAHTVALCQPTLRMRQQNRVLCKRMLRMQYHCASAHCAYCRKLLAYALHMEAICKRMLRIRLQIASVHCVNGNKSSNIPNILCFASGCCACANGSNLLTVCCACGRNLLAQTSHVVAKKKWPVCHPSVKNVKILFHP